MLRDSVGLPLHAIEVPLDRRADGTTVPTVRIGDDVDQGAPLFTFPATTVAGSTLATQAHGPIAFSCVQDDSRALIWHMEVQEPCVVALQDLCLSGGDHKEDEARLEFPCPILPSVSGAATADGSRVFMITADGSLHAIVLRTENSNQGPLHCRLSTHGAVTSVPLLSVFERLGAPTCLVLMGETVCIGTNQGHVVCLPASNPTPETVFELTASAGLLSGLSGVLGSFFGKGGPQPVEQLTELPCMTKSFLCSIHSGSTMRIWDVTSHRLVHSAELLPPQESATYKATLVRATVEPLDASTSILFIFFQPNDPSSDAQGHLCTFEVFLEDRSGAIHVHLEGGPRLAGAVHRLKDLAVQHMGARSVAAWLLYDDSEGWRHLDSVPVTFSDGAVQTAIEVQLIEDQVWDSCPTDSNQLKTLENVRMALQTAASDSGIECSVADGLFNVVLAPGVLSRTVLAEALAEIGATQSDAFGQCTGEVLTPTVSAWVASAAAQQQSTGIVGAWSTLLHAYAKAFRRKHLPVGLLQQTAHREEQALVVVRCGGALSTVRAAQSAELVAAGAWPPEWDRVHVDSAGGTGAVLQAAGAIVEVCGGAAAVSMLRTCILNGVRLRHIALPALLRVVAGGEGGDAQWRARCRALPLTIGERCGACPEGLPAAFSALLGLLSQQLIPPLDRKRSSLSRLPRAAALAALAQAHQIAEVQINCLLRAAILASCVELGLPGTGIWTPSGKETKQLAGPLADRLDAMLTAAGVAYWSLTTLAPLPADSSDADPASMVVALRLGDGSGAEGSGGGDSKVSAPKRARLTPAQQRIYYVAEALFPAFRPSAHMVRDLLDVQSVAASFSRWMLSVSTVRALDPKCPPLEPTIATARALDLAAELLRTRASVPLEELMHVLPGTGAGEDPRLQFFTACSKARATKGAASPTDRRRLEEESAALFFKVAGLFSHKAFFGDQLAAVSAALAHLGVAPSSASGGTESGGDEVQYYEALMTMYEALGCAWAASQFALAAARHVTNAVHRNGTQSNPERVQRSGRLWSSVFEFCLRAGEYEEAYAALLGNDVTEQQIDCVHRLVKVLCDKGEVATLCVLPFSHNALVVHASGTLAWSSLLDEAVVALHRRAASADLDASPQPYKILFDFHVSRGNFQSGAAAMLAYARRLGAEQHGDAGASDEAQRALSAAVGALGLVAEDQAWVENPGVCQQGIQQQQQRQQKNPPLILTLQDLRKEHAAARARAAVAAVRPGGDLFNSEPEEIFNQLLSLGLHDEAFLLADAVFIGTKLDRAREKAVHSLAGRCAELQLRPASYGTDSSAAAAAAAASMQVDETDAMDTQEDSQDLVGGVDATGGAGGGGMDIDALDSAAVPSSADVAWHRLRRHLEMYEKYESTSFSTSDSAAVAVGASGSRLRVVAIEAVLAADRELRPPPWLLAPFLPVPAAGPLAALTAQNGRSADVPGLVRAYMQHGREADAAALAVKYLAVVVDSIPSMALGRPAVVCIPHALFQELAERIPQTMPVRQQLVDKLAAVKAAAAKQTDVLARIYA